MVSANLPNSNVPPDINSFDGFEREETSMSQIILDKINTHTNNATYNSTGKNCVVLIYPKGNELMNNPLKLAAAIDKSVIKHFQEEGKIKEIRTNKKKNIIVVELSDRSEKTIQKILKIKTIGNFEVAAQLPMSDELRYGVISPIGTDVDIEHLKKVIQIRHLNNFGEQTGEITHIERMKKKENNIWVDSMSLKLTFRRCELPVGISIFHSYYKVRPFIGNAFQCFNCQRMGHLSKSCKSKQRCLLCGGNHHREDCDAQQHKCANCSGPHRANSRECQYYSIGQQIEKVRVKQAKTYVEAKKQVLERHRKVENMHTMHSSDSPSYRDRLVGMNKRTETREMATQTEQKVDDMFFDKLKECLVTIIQKIQTGNGTVENIIEDAIQQGFQLTSKRTRSNLSTSSNISSSVSLTEEYERETDLENRSFQNGASKQRVKKKKEEKGNSNKSGAHATSRK